MFINIRYLTEQTPRRHDVGILNINEDNI